MTIANQVGGAVSPAHRPARYAARKTKIATKIKMKDAMSQRKEVTFPLLLGLVGDCIAISIAEFGNRGKIPDLLPEI